MTEKVFICVCDLHLLLMLYVGFNVVLSVNTANTVGMV